MSQNSSDDQTKPKIKLFIIKNISFNTKSIELYLERREFTVQTDTQFNDLIEKVEEFLPDYILVPWDHSDPQMKSFLTLVDTSQTPCIPYITSTATQDNRALMQANSPLKMFPPISGPSIQRMILKIEKQKAMKTQKGAQNVASQKKDPQNQIYIAKGQRAGDLKKEQQKMLHGKVGNSQSDPESDSIHVKSMATTSASPSKSASAVPPSLFDSTTDLTASVPICEFSPRMNLKISEVQKKSLAYKFDSKIQKNLIAFIESIQKNATANDKEVSTSDAHRGDSEDEATSTDTAQANLGVAADTNHIEYTSMYGLLVQSIDSSGFILFYSKWKIDLDEAEAFMQEWSSDLLSHFLRGDHINLNNYQSQVFEIDTQPGYAREENILELCKNKSAIHKAVEIDGKMSLMAFFDLRYNPFNIETARDDNYFIIDHNCLSAPSKLYFDLFFEMKQNQKMLKIYKSDTEMTDYEIQMIHQKNLFPLMVDSAEELNWFKYGVESFLKKP
jgi:hypothetical protein